MTDAQDLAALRAKLARSPLLDVEDATGALRVMRKRRLPPRGLLRLAIPRVRAHVAVREGEPRIAVRPDGIAYLVIVILAGGLGNELAGVRESHPVSYPPEFVYGMAFAYGFFLLIEAIRTRNAVSDALDAAAPGVS